MLSAKLISLIIVILVAVGGFVYYEYFSSLKQNTSEQVSDNENSNGASNNKHENDTKKFVNAWKLSVDQGMMEVDEPYTMIVYKDVGSNRFIAAPFIYSNKIYEYSSSTISFSVLKSGLKEKFMFYYSFGNKSILVKGKDKNDKTVNIGTYNLYVMSLRYVSDVRGEYILKIYMAKPEGLWYIRSFTTLGFQGGVPDAVVIMGLHEGKKEIRYYPQNIGKEEYMPVYEGDIFVIDDLYNIAHIFNNGVVSFLEPVELWEDMYEIVEQPDGKGYSLDSGSGVYKIYYSIQSIGNVSINGFYIPAKNVTFVVKIVKTGKILYDGYVIVSSNTLVPVHWYIHQHRHKEFGIPSEKIYDVQLVDAKLRLKRG